MLDKWAKATQKSHLWTDIKTALCSKYGNQREWQMVQDKFNKLTQTYKVCDAELCWLF